MNRLLNTITLLTVFIIACGGSTPPRAPVDMPSQAQAAAPQTPMDVPSWFMMTPEPDDEYAVYSTGEATSRKMNIAMQKATQQARANLGQSISAKVQSLIESMVEEAGMGENVQITEFYSEASKSVSNETLSGATVVKKYPYQTSSGGYRVYVLMGLKKAPFDNAASQAIVSKVKENQEEAMYATFKKTQAFNRLNEELDK
ncbi:MAG: LPP20 family lipoprotein [Candidatus Neomarinimicrobiota bacterium]|nr:LPP20 family lipoprotein [Candidatus Neomarinimicrobiota bacterium]